MTSLRKKTALIFLSVVLVFSTIFCITFSQKGYAFSPSDIITSQSGVTITLNQAEPNGLDGELKGVKITTNGSSGSLYFNGNKGPFSIKYRALVSTLGTPDVSEVRFDFTNKSNSRESFYVISKTQMKINLYISYILWPNT